MSWAAGTLVTTHNATYIPPRFMPGYRGHCPTLKYDYGETYGNATSKYFQDYRSEVLNSSKFPYCRGGQFPTYYTHNPDLVIGNRTRTQDRWTHAPKYQLSNVNHDRKEELYQFNKMAQSQREYYCDKTGTMKKVDYFQLPVRAEDQFGKHVPFMILSRRYMDKPKPDGTKPDRLSQRGPILRQFAPARSVRDRGMRDVYFEER